MEEQNLGPKGMEHGPPQLPPQMFTTAAQLLDLTDSMLYPIPQNPSPRVLGRERENKTDRQKNSC